MASSSAALNRDAAIESTTRCRIDSSSWRPSMSSSANVSSTPTKYFAGVMLWYTSTIGSGRARRNDDTVGSPIDEWYTSTPREPPAPYALSGSTSDAEPGATWRAYTSDGPI